MNKKWFYRLLGLTILLALLFAAGQSLTAQPKVAASSGIQTVTFQHGVNGYTGTQDVGIIAWTPHTNYDGGINDQMEIRSTGQLAGLLQFDLTSIPSDATVNSAILSVYVPYRYGPRPITVGVYEVFRPWVASQATWMRASTSTPWGFPGCDDTTTDRAALPEVNVTMFNTWQWYHYDITHLVGKWVANPSSNHGMAFKAFGDAAGIKIVTSEHGGTWMHPKLTITYTPASGPAPTATSTATRTSTPTPTPTGTITPQATPTATATTSGHVVTLQHGVNGYTGTEDVGIIAWFPNTNYDGGANDTMEVRSTGQKVALLRFDLTSIPASATVTAAVLSVYAPERYGPRPLTVGVYEVYRHWVAAQATFNKATSGDSWGVPGCNDTTSDRAAIPESSVSMFGTWQWYEFNITNMVQKWVSNPSTNHGMVFQSRGNAAGMKLVTSEHSGIWMHPKLTIYYQN